MKPLTFRAVMDDGSTTEWEQEITMPDGTVKPASIDDIDRSKLSNLLTVDYAGNVFHSLGFPEPERATKLAVWRLNSKWTGEGSPTVVGALAGYNQLFPDGHTELKLDLIQPDGTISSAAGFEVQLHPREVFTPEKAKEIRDAQEAQNALTEADNAAMAEAERIREEELALTLQPDTVITTDGNGI